jgi:hypothetical protein
MSKIPLFKSDYSLGRSILTLEEPSKVTANGPSSIFKIAADNNLSEVYILDDNISSFPDAWKSSKNTKIKLRYGVIFHLKDRLDEEKSSSCKIAIFALNDDGFDELKKLYTKVHVSCGGFVSFENLSNLSKNLGLCIPFYDSFLHKNFFTFAKFTQDFASLKPVFFVENNGLPVDEQLREIVESYCKNNNCDIQPTKTILYEKNSDVLAYMTHRIVCSRSGEGGPKKTLEKPGLEGLGSDQFSFESYNATI